jgi:hypothetical protein
MAMSIAISSPSKPTGSAKMGRALEASAGSRSDYNYWYYLDITTLVYYVHITSICKLKCWRAL